MDSLSFKEFEREGWDRAFRDYIDYFSSLTAQSIAPLLDALETSEGSHVLDVACGPGALSVAARERLAQVIGIDLSANVVKETKLRLPQFDIREGDAEALPFDDESFDAVAMNFGIIHLPHPEKAIAEAYRVLKPGGRYGFTAWRIPTETKGFGLVSDVVREFGDMTIPLPEGPNLFLFDDPEQNTRLLTKAGFSNVQTAVVPQIWKLGSAEELFEAFYNGAVRIAALLRGQSPDVLEKIRTVLLERSREFEDRDGLSIPMPARLVWAEKPK